MALVPYAAGAVVEQVGGNALTQIGVGIAREVVKGVAYEGANRLRSFVYDSLVDHGNQLVKRSKATVQGAGQELQTRISDYMERTPEKPRRRPPGWTPQKALPPPRYRGPPIMPANSWMAWNMIRKRTNRKRYRRRW